MNVAGRAAALISGLLFGSLLVLLPPGLTALALLTAVVAVIILRRPLVGLQSFAFVATLIPYTTVQLGIRITISEALLALTWLSVIPRWSVGRLPWKPGLTERRLIWLMLYSAAPFVVGQIVFTDAEGSGLVNWLRWLLNLSVLFLIPLLLGDEASRERVIVALLLGTLLMLLLSITYFLKDRNAATFIPVLRKLRYAHPEAVDAIFSANYTRMASPWVHPNLTGGALVLVLPLALYYALQRQGARRLLGLSVTVLGAAGLLFSISRGAIVSLALTLLLLSWRRAPHAARIALAGSILVVLVVLFYPPLQQRLAKTFSASNESTEIRLEEYRHFPQAMSQYPLGIGFKVDPPPPGTKLLGISNLWLNFVYKIGLAGLMLFVGVIAAWWKETRPRRSLARLGAEQSVWIGTGAGLTAALLTGLFDHYYSFTTVLIALFWLMTGLNLQSARRLAQAGDPLLTPARAQPAGYPGYAT